VSVDLERVVFIVGVGRSGTTLLQCMLNAHSRLVFLPETHFLRRWGGHGGPLSCEELRSDKDLMRTGLDPCGEPGPTSPRALYLSLLRRYAEKRGAGYVGDKDPKNVEYLPRIREWFPRARVIHLVRDPRDVVLSRMRAKWSRKRPFMIQVLICREQLKLGCRLGPELFKDSYREVRYEDLIESPAEILESICRDLDLAFEPGMLDYAAGAAEMISGEETLWKSNCFRPIMRGNRGNWRGVLSPRRIRFIETVCGEAFERFHYKREYPHAHGSGGGVREVALRRLDRCYLRRYSGRKRRDSDE